MVEHLEHGVVVDDVAAAGVDDNGVVGKLRQELGLVHGDDLDTESGCSFGHG